MTAADFTRRDRQRWGRGAVPGWVPRIGLTVGWVVAVAAGFLPAVPCSVEDPSVCGADVGWSLGAAFLLATPVLLVTAPALGCLAGVLFAVAELRWEEVTLARAAFVVHGVACAAVLAWMLLARRHQVAVAAAVAGPDRTTMPPGAPGPHGRGPRTARTVVALVLVLAGVGSLVLWRYWTAQDERHLAAATRMTARVVATADDGATVRLRLPDREDEVSLDVLDSYPVGAAVPVLLDRSGGGRWVTLVAEPPDSTFPLSAGLAAWLVALALVGCERARRRALTRLSGDPGPAVTVLVDRDLERATLRAVGAGRPFAVVPLALPADNDPGWDEEDEPELQRPAGTWATEPAEWGEEWSAEEVAVFGSAWRGADRLDPPPRPEPAPLPGRVRMTVVGDLRQGGWVALTDGTEVLWPRGTLRLPGRSDRLAGEMDPADADDTDEDHSAGSGPFRGEPVLPAAGPPATDLPYRLRPATRYRLLGATMLLGFAAGPLAAAYLAEGWYQTLLSLVLGGQLGLAGLGRLQVGLQLTRGRLLVHERTRVHAVPWAALHGARRDGDHLLLAWTPDILIDTGPFRSPTGSTIGVTPADTAERAGADIMRLRSTALAAGDPGARPTSRWNATIPVGAVYAAAGIVEAVLLLR